LALLPVILDGNIFFSFFFKFKCLYSGFKGGVQTSAPLVQKVSSVVQKLSLLFELAFMGIFLKRMTNQEIKTIQL